MQTFGYRKPVHFVETPRGVEVVYDLNAPGELRADPPRKFKPKRQLSRVQLEEHARCIDTKDHPKAPLRITAPMSAKARGSR